MEKEDFKHIVRGGIVNWCNHLGGNMVIPLVKKIMGEEYDFLDSCSEVNQGCDCTTVCCHYEKCIKIRILGPDW